MYRPYTALTQEEREHALLNECGELLILMSSTDTDACVGISQTLVMNFWTLAFTDDRKEAEILLDDILKDLKTEAYSRLRAMSWPDSRSVGEKPKKKSKRERNRENKVARTRGEKRGCDNAFA